jgi:hypothetical protein
MGEAPTVVLDLVDGASIAGDLAAGGVFVPGCALAIDDDCELVLRGNGDELRVHARVVFANDHGAGLQLATCDASIKQRIAALAATDTDADADPDPDPDPVSSNVHERLRHLSLAEQIRTAQRGEVHERIVLERIYGKTVWEPLLRNPRVTGPEVARIARMGALPRPLMEIIVGNGAWLQIPDVRRALLANPRLGNDQILRVLRLVPKHELKLATVQTAYPPAVRDAARRMLRGEE